MEKDNRMYSLKELRARKNRTQKQVAADIGVSEQTLQVVTDINGYNEQAMKDILYSVTGYNDLINYKIP